MRAPASLGYKMGKKSARHGLPATKSVVHKTEALRALRLAREAESRTAGTWGETSVGEILHEGSRSVFVQTWKGARRPDPFEDGVARRDLARGTDWTAMIAWVNARSVTGFVRRIVAWDLSKTEANKIVLARIAEHRAAGYTVVNPAETVTP